MGIRLSPWEKKWVYLAVFGELKNPLGGFHTEFSSFKLDNFQGWKTNIIFNVISRKCPQLISLFVLVDMRKKRHIFWSSLYLSNSALLHQQHFKGIRTPPRRCCQFSSSSGQGPVWLCHYNISKNSSHDLTLLPLTGIVKISLRISTGDSEHDLCEGCE